MQRFFFVDVELVLVDNGGRTETETMNVTVKEDTPQ
jgi:hypothetical protein